uniref:polynucleotide adenylyltransferase n=1 Tax=Phallusia mammillata TaxID=59560 RepID=A0A6F9DV40_9ASCI|nr:poly(A) RNA polymerase gld-2 [Phallusia mammillata]
MSTKQNHLNTKLTIKSKNVKATNNKQMPKTKKQKQKKNAGVKPISAKEQKPPKRKRKRGKKKTKVQTINQKKLNICIRKSPNQFVDCIIISSDSETEQKYSKQQMENNTLGQRQLGLYQAGDAHCSSAPTRPGQKQNLKRKAPGLPESNENKRPCYTQTQISQPISGRQTQGTNQNRVVSQEMFMFLNYYEQKSELLRKKFELQQALENAIKFAMFPLATVHLVGSSINGFGRFDSDADICVVLDATKRNISRKESKKALYELEKLLRRAPFVKKLEIIHAKVQILKFVDHLSGMDCDVNINNLIGVRNTFLLFAYARYDPRVRPLALCVKAWAKNNDINDAKHATLSSYALVLMVIHYLQCGTQPAVLPSLQNLHPEMFSERIPICAVEAYSRRVPLVPSRNQQTLYELLRGFFRYFSCFDYDDKVISVRRGTKFSVENLPHSELWKQKPIKIEEPFDSNNVARAVHNYPKAQKIINEFRKASRTTELMDHLNVLIHGAPCC